MAPSDDCCDHLAARPADGADRHAGVYSRLWLLVPPVAGFALGTALYTSLADETVLYNIWPGLSIDPDVFPPALLFQGLGTAFSIAAWTVVSKLLAGDRPMGPSLRATAPGFAPCLLILLLYALNTSGTSDLTSWAVIFGVFAIAFALAWFAAVGLARGGRLWRAADSLAKAAPVIVVVLGVVYLAVSAGMGLLQHRAVMITYSDTADFDEMLWRTLHGDFLATSCFEHSFLGQHLEFVQLFLLPLYILWPGMGVLLVIQSVVIASGVIPVYLLARFKIGSRAASAFFAAAYVLYAPVQYLDKQVISNPYLPEVMYVTFMLWAVYFLFTRRMWLLLLMSFLIVSCKEDLALPVAMFGVIMIARRQWKWGVGYLIGGFAWFILAFTVLVPYFEQAPSHVLAPHYYGRWGTSVGEIISNVFSDPAATFRYMFAFKRIDFLLMMLVPMGMLALLSPSSVVIFLPSIASCLLASWQPSSVIYFHYHLSIAPFPVIGAIFGAANLIRILPQYEPLWGGVASEMRGKIVAVFCGILVFSASGLGDVLYGKFPWSLSFYNPASYSYWGHLYVQTPRARLFLEEVLPMIPAEAKVSASDCLNTRFTHHAACYKYPTHLDEVDYIVLQESEPTDMGPVWSVYRLADEGTRFDGFERIYAKGGIYVFRRSIDSTDSGIADVP